MNVELDKIECKFEEFLKYARILDESNKERIKPKVSKIVIELSAMLHDFIDST